MKRSTLLRYGVATLAVAVVLLLKLLLDPLIADQSPFLLLAGAVMVAAWFGGMGPGLLATVLGALAADYYFLPPLGAVTGLGLGFLPVFLFALQGLLISSLAEALRAARGRAEASAHEARSHQESLCQSEERFRLLIEGVEDYAIFMLDPEGRVATWNAGAKRINGYDEDEIIGEYLSVFYTEEDVRRGHPEEELRVATSEGRYREEGLRVRKDGSRFWASVLITALRDEEGTLRGFSKVTRDITARKEAEHALKENEQRFRTLVQNSSDVITVIDADGSIRYVSPAVERLTGYRPEELVGKSVHYYVDPENLEEAQTMFAELWSRPGVHPPFEFEVLHKDGTRRNSEFIVNNLLDDPSVRGVVVNQRDVTERTEAEKKLRESERRFRQLFENSSDALFVHDAQGRFVDCNTEACRALGYSQEELLELSVADVTARLISEEERGEKKGETLWERAMRGEPGRIVGFDENELVRKDGSTFPVEVGVGTIEYGGQRMIFASARDISERKRAEDALKEGEAKYRTLVEQIPAVTYIEELDVGEPEWNMVYVSPQVVSLLGYSPEEYMSKPKIWEELLHPDDRERVLAEDARTERSGEPFRVQYRIFTRNGDVAWIRDEAILVRDEEGSPLFWQGVMYDITDQKRAEEALRRSLDVLLALYETGQVLSSSLEREEIGSRLLEIMGRVSGMTAAVINLRDDRGCLSAWRTFGP